MPSRGDSKYENVPTFMLQGDGSFKVMGFSADLGTCSAKTNQGQSCRQFVNLSVSQLCPSHVMKQWNRASSARGELSAKTGTHGLSGAGSAWQKTKGDFFFAGGKTFQALPPSHNPACNQSAMLDSLAKSHANKGVRDGMKEMKKNPGIVVMNAPAGKLPPENTNVMVKSSMHGGRMLAAALGRSHENESLMASKRMKTPDPKVTSISAGQLLKQKNEEFAARKREALKRQKEEALKKASAAGKSPSLGVGLSRGLNLTGGPKGNSLFSSLKLGSAAGVSNQTKSVEERRKLRAAAILKNKNTKKSPEVLQSTIMSRVSQDQGEKKEKVERTFMGQKTSQVDIKAIMEKKSKYHASVEDLMSAEQDFYFSVLEKREEAQTKMDGVMKADAQVVTCKDCKYTYWSPHESCKKQNHNLVWKQATKRWFQCKNCPTQRAITFSKYPKTSCSSCGQGTRWVRVSAGDTNRVAAKERDNLLIRGEERKWVNS